MKRNDIEQANDLVTIKVIGSGLNAWAYFVSDEIYEIISKNKDEDDPIEIITNQVNESALVCLGIDIDSDFEIFAEMSGEHVPLRAVSTYEGFDMADAISDLSIDQSEALIECNTDESNSLGEDLNLDATNHVFIACISWGSIL